MVVLLLEMSNKAVLLFIITYLNAKLCHFFFELILNRNQQWALVFLALISSSGFF